MTSEDIKHQLNNNQEIMMLHKQQKQQQRQHINKSRQIGRQAVRQTETNKLKQKQNQTIHSFSFYNCWYYQHSIVTPNTTYSDIFRYILLASVEG